MAGNTNDNAILDWYIGIEEASPSPLLIPELSQGFLGRRDQQVNYIYCTFMEIHNSVLQAVC